MVKVVMIGNAVQRTNVITWTASRVNSDVKSLKASQGSINCQQLTCSTSAVTVYWYAVSIPIQQLHCRQGIQHLLAVRKTCNHFSRVMTQKGIHRPPNFGGQSQIPGQSLWDLCWEEK